MADAPIMSSNIYESARDSLAAIVGSIAERKNVPFQPEAYAAVAERALDFMELPAIYDFMALRDSGARAAASALNRSLDLYFAISIYACIGQLEQRADITAACEALGEKLLADLLPIDVPFYRWPALMEMVARCNRARIEPQAADLRVARGKRKPRRRKRGRHA